MGEPILELISNKTSGRTTYSLILSNPSYCFIFDAGSTRSVFSCRSVMVHEGDAHGEARISVICR